MVGGWEEQAPWPSPRCLKHGFGSVRAESTRLAAGKSLAQQRSSGGSRLASTAQQASAPPTLTHSKRPHQPPL